MFPLSFEVQENAWHHITTQTSSSGYLSTSINGSQVFNVSRSAYPVATASFTGTFGFGAYQDQEAYFRNVIVTDTANGSTLYENDMRSDNVLAEYGTQSNIASVCLDGAKRDRLVWMGDFYHTSRIIPVSTSRTDLSVGTLQFLLDTQLPDGELSISPGMGYDPFQAYHSFYPSGVAGLQDYQILGLLAFANHVSATNDVAWASETWPSWQRQVNWLLSKINSTDGLIYLNSAFLGDKAGGSALSCAAVQALTKVADVASAINDTSSMKTYLQAAEALKQSVNNRLWNESMGIYSLSPEYPTDNSVTSTAFCITSGVASANQTSKLLQSLEQLRLGPGYKDYSQYNNSDPTVNISPNTNGFLLDALFMANASEQAASLLVDLWSTMLPGTEEKDKFASGASWEYVNAATSQPGLSLFTSLSHPWGGAATYVLTERVAGLRAADGTSGFGYRNWVIDPQMGLRMGLTSASARVETAFGGALSVQWTVNRNAIHVKILAPSSTTGVFTLGGTTRSLSGKSAYEFGISI